jgi:hypothetical protein
LNLVYWCKPTLSVSWTDGGHGQRRQNFNDLHVLDLDSKCWLGEEQNFAIDREGGIKTVSLLFYQHQFSNYNIH